MKKDENEHGFEYLVIIVGIGGFVLALFAWMYFNVPHKICEDVCDITLLELDGTDLGFDIEMFENYNSVESICTKNVEEFYPYFSNRVFFRIENDIGKCAIKTCQKECHIGLP